MDAQRSGPWQGCELPLITIVSPWTTTPLIISFSMEVSNLSIELSLSRNRSFLWIEFSCIHTPTLEHPSCVSLSF